MTTPRHAGTRRRRALAALCVVLSSACAAQPSDEVPVGRAVSAPSPRSVAADDLQQTLDAARIAFGAPGAVAAIGTGESMRTLTSGVADATETPVAADMRFRIGSITKTLVSALVLDRVAQRTLDLDGAVAPLIDAPLRPAPPVTVRMLLDHTSGIFDIGNDGDPVADVADLTDPTLLAEVAALADGVAAGRQVVASAELIVALAETHDRLFEPGTGFGYSNTNFQLAGMVVAQTAGRPLSTMLAERIARPLGLRATTLAPDDRTSPAFRGHATDLDTGATIDATDDLLAFGNGGNGGAVSTVSELLIALDAIVHGPLLPKPLRLDMVTMTEQSDHSYGLGIATYQLSCGRFVGHEGRVNGVVSIALVDAVHPGTGAVVAMNSTGGDPELDDLVDSLVCGGPASDDR